MMKEASEIRSILAQHYCTSQYHACLRGIDGPFITDGVLEMARLCRAFWLIDLIVAAQRDKNVNYQLFQVWRLTLDQDNGSAMVTCTDGDNKFVAQREIASTDFPLPEGIVLWKDGEVILLPSEY
jgi:hypothetical protein